MRINHEIFNGRAELPLRLDFSPSTIEVKFPGTTIITALTLALLFFACCAPAQTNTAIRGTVTDEKKSPLAAVRVQIMGMEELRDGKWTRAVRSGDMPVYLSDKNGRFEIPQSGSNVGYDLCCDKEGFAPMFFSGISAASSPLQVVLERGVTIVGRVTQPIGVGLQPVVGAKVELELPSPDFWYQKRAVTDSNGEYSFQVTDPPAGRKWQISFAARRKQFVVKKGEPVIALNFTDSSEPKGGAKYQSTNHDTAWVEQCLKDFESITNGMTRAQVESKLRPDGGLRSASPVRFVHPDCSYFKIKVEFEFKRDPADQDRAVEGQDDKVTRVSKPYLERPFSD